MKRYIESIQVGFLEATGASLHKLLLLVLASVLVLAIGLVSRGSMGWKTLIALCLLSMAPFAFLWWRSLKRIQVLREDVSYLRSGLMINSARYGRGDLFADVAPYLQKKIADGKPKIPVADNLLDGGKDPCPGSEKELTVEYSRMVKQIPIVIPQTKPPKILDLA